MIHTAFAGIGIFLASLFGTHHAPPTVNSAATVLAIQRSQSASTSAQTASSTQPTTTVINQPVIERIIERAASSSAENVTEPELNARLKTFSDMFSTQIAGVVAANKAALPNVMPVPQYIAAGGDGANPNALTNRIDKLSNVTISNAIVNGVSGLTAADLPALSGLNGLLDISQGGTGTSTIPSYGQLMLGDGLGRYTLVSTSSLGITGNGISSWGNITGTLANQADLQTALSAKLGSTSLSATAPLSFSSSSGIFSITQSGIGTNGYLSTTDWNLFNNKISSSSLSGGTGVSYNASTGVIGLNLTSANSWTALQQFRNASTTLFSAYGPVYFGATATSTFSSNGTLTLATPLTTGSGGTGASTFGQGWIYSNGSTGALAASTSPTVNYLTATSTTATSTIAGNLSAGGTLSVTGSGAFGQDAVVGVGVDGVGSVSVLNVSKTFTDASVYTEPISFLNTANFSADGGNVYAIINFLTTPTTNTKNIGDYYGQYNVTESKGSGTVGEMVGVFADARQKGAGNVSDIIPLWAEAEHYGSGSVTTQQAVRAEAFIRSSASASASVASQYGLVIASGNAKAGATVTSNYGVWFSTPSHIGTITNSYAFYSNDLGGVATNPYYSWFDSRGVGRCKEDNTFNSVGQSICVVYNPQFAKYTAGAANYERIVYGQWNSNTAQIGTDAGGTGTLRPLQLVGSAVGIGTSTPAKSFSVVGSTYLAGSLLATSTVQFSNFGAGTLQTDANGNLSVSSDERLKNVQGNFVRGLSDILKLSPILYTWRPETGYDALTTYAGFSAQNVQLAIPEAVGQDHNGFLTLQDRPLIAALVNAIKELSQKLTDLSSTVAGFADNIVSAHISATNADFDEVNTKKLCVGATCITESQFQALLNQVGQQSSAPSAPVIDAPSIVPDDAMATTTP